VKKLNVTDIRIDGGTQIRKQLNNDKVTEYAEQMKDGEIFPAITVFFDGSDHWLASGFHRYFANKQIGNTVIDCDVKEGTVRNARLFAFGANGHGLPHTSEENRQIVLEMSQDSEWKNWTNAQIAKHIHISAMTVGRIKKAMQIEEADEKKYINKHGKEATINTKNLGKKTTKPESKPESKPAPESKPDDDRIKELSYTIEELADENTLLKDKIAIGQWNASEIEKIDIEDVVADLREQLRIAHIEINSLRDSRDMFQNRHAEAVKIINAMKKKYKVKD